MIEIKNMKGRCAQKKNNKHDQNEEHDQQHKRRQQS